MLSFCDAGILPFLPFPVRWSLSSAVHSGQYSARPGFGPWWRAAR